ncbi:hypothetical protein CWI42_120580 [Ordospora colligata]|uniref:Uncharacterized protein n=1 Tax=Ordospora colligata OC4 TaxID=1354746 RepID=A0A0B2UI06_9MICR|nr:uncharacterized protein M896_120580 [Ordospora colligata OC4]KHN68839.1 hypothetical protein M896_120580 [Ordospora colligata OC4]TBU13873.1 hypothetical protein CWI40_120580 [Ordospora colligata]TBU14062.1 hypothetical protein CWI41_120580 [Ordospora colligata]TBU17731.1 hypothetical protein CWI42_120580 [Ordospora colligata]
MEHWVMNFLSINQNHVDVSDYEKFFVHFRRYLNENPCVHKKVARILVKSLRVFKNKALLSISYRLLCDIDAKISIRSAVMQRHFRSKTLRSHMLMLILKLNVREFDGKLKKLLYDPWYECRTFFELMKARKEWVIKLLECKSKELARKQMVTMIHTGIFHNLDYFITYIGDADRSLSFLGFEVFSLFISEFCESKRIQGDTGRDKDVILYESEMFEVRCNHKGVWIQPRRLIKLGCSINFVIHFIEFMAEKKEMHEWIARRDVDAVESVVRKYAEFEGCLRLPDNVWTVQPRRCSTRRICDEQNEDVCFEYLFDGKSHKEAMDCIEI